MAPNATVRFWYGALSVAISHFMKSLAQSSSVAGSGLSVHDDFVTRIAVAGIFGAKKSVAVPLTSVPVAMPIPSGFDAEIEGLIERSDPRRPAASASAITV